MQAVTIQNWYFKSAFHEEMKTFLVRDGNIIELRFSPTPLSCGALLTRQAESRRMFADAIEGIGFTASRLYHDAGRGLPAPPATAR